jgi:hypothetical protein
MFEKSLTKCSVIYVLSEYGQVVVLLFILSNINYVYWWKIYNLSGSGTRKDLLEQMKLKYI